MTITKAIRDYATMVIRKKYFEMERKLAEEENQKFQKLDPKIRAILIKAENQINDLLKKNDVLKSIQLVTIHGNMVGIRSFSRHYNSEQRRLDDVIKEVLVSIELDQIPRNEVKAYIDNYEIDLHLTE